MRARASLVGEQVMCLTLLLTSLGRKEKYCEVL
jgi:hypothetical protein